MRGWPPLSCRDAASFSHSFIFQLLHPQRGRNMRGEVTLFDLGALRGFIWDNVIRVTVDLEGVNMILALFI